MTSVRVFVLRTAGINCDEETVHAWESAGARAGLVHVDELIRVPSRLNEAQVLTVPGGFSYGDDVAAGKILANRLSLHLADELRDFVSAGSLLLGICNGFQVLVKAGLLPGLVELGPRVTLAFNDSGRFEARWVHLRVDTDRCCFLPRGALLRMPVAHAEGKVVGDEPTRRALSDGGHVALRYCTEDGRPGEYPANPNGSLDHIAGLTDSSGRVLGLMPHPERHVDRTHDPLWTRRTRDGEPDGLAIFRNAVRHFQ